MKYFAVGMRHIFVGQNFARISNFIFILRLDAISAFERFGLDVNGGTAEYIWTMRRNSEIGDVCGCRRRE